MTDTAVAVQCRATTRTGAPCRNPYVLPSGLCSTHDPNGPAYAAFIDPERRTVSPGRPKLPSNHERMLQLIDERLHEVFGVYFDAINPANELSVRITGADRLLDRALGKPRQSSDVTLEAGESLRELLAPSPLEWSATLLPEGDE